MIRTARKYIVLPSWEQVAARRLRRPALTMRGRTGLGRQPSTVKCASVDAAFRDLGSQIIGAILRTIGAGRREGFQNDCHTVPRMKRWTRRISCASLEARRSGWGANRGLATAATCTCGASRGRRRCSGAALVIEAAEAMPRPEFLPTSKRYVRRTLTTARVVKPWLGVAIAGATATHPSQRRSGEEAPTAFEGTPATPGARPP